MLAMFHRPLSSRPATPKNGEIPLRYRYTFCAVYYLRVLLSSYQINIKGNYILAREFLPYKKEGGTIVANSSGFAFLPPGLPFLAKKSAYSISKLGTARFYEFLAVEHPDLNVFILQPAIVRTALYTKGEFTLNDTVDTSKLSLSLYNTSSYLTVLSFSSRRISPFG
jgi:short-subunit dehydrogenase